MQVILKQPLTAAIVSLVWVICEEVFRHLCLRMTEDQFSVLLIMLMKVSEDNPVLPMETKMFLVFSM